MAYNGQLNIRVMSMFSDVENITSKNMFGGVGYLLNGNSVCGVYKDDLILRMSLEDADNALTQKNVKPFDIKERTIKRWIMLEPRAIQNDDKLKNWINISLSFVQILPTK